MPNQIEKSPDGRIKATLETGEVFEGDPLEITQKMAEAHVSTKRWGQEWKQKAETVPPVQPQNPTTQPQNPAVDPNAKQLQDYLLTQHAQALGYKSADEYRQEELRRKQREAQDNMEKVVLKFNSAHPEFNASEENAGRLTDYAFEAYGLSQFGFKDFDSFAAVRPDLAITYLDHSVAAMYQKGEMKPMSQQEQHLANSERATIEQQRSPAPPMLGRNNPELATGNNANDPYNMPIAELRKAAIRQELDGKR